MDGIRIYSYICRIIGSFIRRYTAQSRCTRKTNTPKSQSAIKLRLMKKLITLTMLIAASVAISAKSLVLVLTDGTLVYYYLGGDTNPVMKFEGNKVSVDTDAFTFENIQKFYVSQTDATGIDDKKEVTTSFDGSALYVNTTEGTVGVYKTDGTKMEVTVSKTDNMTVVQTSSLERGVYIVKVGNTSLKFYKK